MKNIAILTTLFLAASYSHNAAADYTVTCESNSGQTRNCPLHDGGRPHLQTQLSRAGCYEGQTWGTHGNSIWVSNGCRATFKVSQNNFNYDSHSNRHDSSDSSDNGKALAATAAVIIGVAAIAAAANKDDDNNHGSYSHNDDNYNNNNYQNNNFNNRYSGGYGNQFTVTCESEGHDRKRCPLNIGRANVEIRRQLSKSNCRFGNDWDYDRNAIYVWNGCRAVFSVN